MLVKIGLVQINNSFSGQNYLPYSVGLLQGYAQKYLTNPENYEFLHPIYCRLPVENGVEHLKSADIIGFSTYVWNIRISLEIARRIKEQKPETLIVFGGPQVPDIAEEFLRKHPFIDIACHGEGEAVFLKILERYPSRNWEGIPSISYIAPKGSFQSHPMAQKIKELSTIPSPYLEGIFDPLMTANPEEQWLILWETNRGCPFSCTFCDWGSATQGKIYTFEIERLFNEIDWFAKKKIEFIFCCDANFGMLKRDVEIAKHVALTKNRYDYPRALSVQSTKNATDRAYEIQKLLAETGLNKGVTISLQSVNPATLNSIKRQNISSKSFQDLQQRLKKANIETYTDILLALPDETYDSFANGVSQIIENGQHNRIQFGNLSILPNAEMGNPEYQKKYGMELVETKIINLHGALEESDSNVWETQQLVIATNTMSRRDWVRTRTFSWVTALLHFNKLLQIPLVILHELCCLSYREMIELFSDGKLESYPTIKEMQTFFMEKARDIQNGGAEYSHSNKWLNIWWPTDEYIFIKLSVDNKLDDFYEEAERLLSALLTDKSKTIPHLLLHQAIKFNRALIKQPFQNGNIEFESSYNIWEFYKGALKAESIPLEDVPGKYLIDRSENWSSWEEWCKYVVWYGNKKGAYLYGNREVEQQIAGHY